MCAAQQWPFGGVGVGQWLHEMSRRCDTNGTHTCCAVTGCSGTILAMAGKRDSDGDSGADRQAVPGSDRADGGMADGSPPCAICARTGGETRRLVHLTHGVSVWLCRKHAGEAFLRDDGGTVFAGRLAAMWLATGSLTARRAAAVRAHMRQMQFAGAARDQPGSYSWPTLRREAEQRFASGHDPQRVIQELRHRHADCPAMAPSIRTMRRWYTQARWLASPPPSPGKPRRSARRPVPGAFALIPYALTQHLRWDYVDPRWRGG
jgi:hypothetical protein